MRFLKRMSVVLFSLSVSVAFSVSIVRVSGDADHPAVINKSITGITPASAAYQSNFLTGSYNYYDQLDTNQRAVFNKLKDLTPASGLTKITLPSSITFTAKSGNPTEAEMKPASDEISRIMQGALDVLLKDCPEIFWLKFDNNGCSYGWELSGVKEGSSRYRFTISRLTFSPVLIDSYVPIKSTISGRLQAEINSFPVSGGSRYQKVLSIHDGLANRIAYDVDFSSDRAYDAYGALVDGEAVCEGYSEAFKLICDKEGIPCILVVGTGVSSAGSGPHMWNAVKMEDDKWYGVDVTWDDQTENYERIYKEFLLVGSDTRDKTFGRKQFSQSHQASGFFTNADFSIEFVYPPLSLSAYVPDANMTTTTASVPGTTTTEPPVIIPPLPTGTTAEPILLTTGAKKTETTGSTAKADKPAAKKTKTGTTAAAGLFTGAADVTTSVINNYQNQNVTESDAVNMKETEPENSSLSLLYIAPFLVGGITVLTVALLIIIFVRNIRIQS